MSKSKLWNKYLCIPLLLSIFCSIFFGVIKSGISVWFISLAANIFLMLILYLTGKLLNIKFTKKEIIILIFFILLMYIFYFVNVIGRKFIYYWDYSCYYNLQLNLEKSFNVSFIDGIKSFVGSTWSGEYGNFLSFFPEMIFNFTNKTINSYLISCVLIFIPYVIFSASIFLKVMANKFKLKNNMLFLTIGLFVLSFYPLLHATFIYGQPDVFGIVFIFLIISLTFEYDFKKLDGIRLSILLIVTFMLLITRRWYMYFIISYYLCYGVSIVISSLKERKQLMIIIKNMVIYFFMAALFFSITLLPLFKNILLSNFSSSYSYYMGDGFKGEIISQINHLGYIFLFIIIIGIIYGVLKKDFRKYSIIFLLQNVFIMILFTKIQNMGLHHSLLLLFSNLFFIYLFVIMIYDKKIVLFIIGTIIFANFSISLSNYKSSYFTDIKLKVLDDKNYSSIKMVCDWMINNLDKKDKVYMINHNNTYNPDKFRNFYMPNTVISDKLPYGSAILGVHKFPIELFSSKYIITTKNFEAVSIERKYNNVFIELVKQGKFKLKKDFVMNDGNHILIYQRVTEADESEINLYLEALEEESKQYPHLYKDVIETYKKDS